MQAVDFGAREVNLTQKNIEKILAFSILVSLLLTPLFDYLTVYYRHSQLQQFERLSIVVRFIMLTMSMLFILLAKGITKKTLKLIIPILISLSIMWISIGLITSQIFNIKNGLETTIFIYKLLVFFVLYSAFIEAVRLEYISLQSLLNCVSFIILIYCFSIIIGSVFNIDLFKNYGESGRWGVKGIMIAGNEASGFLLIALAWALLGLSSFNKYFYITIVVLSMLLSGTKTAYISVILLFASYYYAKVGRYLFLVKSGQLIITLILIMGFAFYFSNSVRFIVGNTMSYFDYQFNNFANESIITLLLSGRDYKLAYVYENIFQYTPYYLLVGGYPISSYYVEMDLFDLIPAFGFYGTICYIYFWFEIWRNGNISAKESKFKKGFIISFILIAFFAGHLLYSALVAPYLAALATYFHFGGELVVNNNKSEVKK